MKTGYIESSITYRPTYSSIDHRKRPPQSCDMRKRLQQKIYMVKLSFYLMKISSSRTEHKQQSTTEKKRFRWASLRVCLCMRERERVVFRERYGEGRWVGMREVEERMGGTGDENASDENEIWLDGIFGRLILVQVRVRVCLYPHRMQKGRLGRHDLNQSSQRRQCSFWI